MCFSLRLYKFDSPIADWHSFRQSDTAAVSKNFINHGFDLLHPRYFDISNIQSGKDNPMGYRMVEFPIYNFLHAGFFSLLGFFTLEQWGRLVTIVFSSLNCFIIYKLISKYSNKTAALSASFFYSVLPFGVFYGRSILPDTSMISAVFAGIYFFDLWVDKNTEKNHYGWIFYLSSLIFMTCAFLLKPYAIFFTLPLFYLIFYKFGLSFFKKWQIYIYFILALLPLILWRLWIQQYPEGIPASDWLFNAGNIRFKGAFFYWLFAERIGKLILGYWGLIILGVGFLNLSRKNHFSKNLFLFSFLLSSLIYITVMARGNVQHDYYQILIFPSLCIFLGMGSSFLLKPISDQFYRFSGVFLLIISVIFSITFSWYYIRDFYNINNPSIIIAGKAVDTLTPKNAKIIAIVHGSEGDTTFLYHSNRQGWPAFENSLPELIKKGADYLVFASPTLEDFNYQQKYKILASSKDYLILDLHSK